MMYSDKRPGAQPGVEVNASRSTIVADRSEVTSAYDRFLAENPQYGYGSCQGSRSAEVGSGRQGRLIDQIREEEFPLLRHPFSTTGAVYLDHAGATLYGKTQLRNAIEPLSQAVHGNPHSQARVGLGAREYTLLWAAQPILTPCPDALSGGSIRTTLLRYSTSFAVTSHPLQLKNVSVAPVECASLES